MDTLSYDSGKIKSSFRSLQILKDWGIIVDPKNSNFWQYCNNDTFLHQSQVVLIYEFDIVKWMFPKSMGEVTRTSIRKLESFDDCLP